MEQENNSASSGLSNAHDQLLNDLNKSTDESSIAELDSLEKFKFEGKEWTPDSFKKEWKESRLRQADYTKKTQEIASEKKFLQNWRVDLEKVRQNPYLAEEFKKVYPQQYHTLLDLIDQSSAKQQPQTQAPQQQNLQAPQQTQQTNLPPELMQKLTQMEQFVNQYTNEQYQAKVSANERELEAMEKELMPKYPKAMPELVYNQMQYMMENNQFPVDEFGNQQVSKADWENIYKSVHERVVQLVSKDQVDKFNTIKNTNMRTKDAGRGGMTPSQAPKSMKLNEVSDFIVQDLMASKAR